MTLMHADHNPLRKLLLPPPFTVDRAADDAFAAGRAAATDGASAGSLLLAELAGRMELAVVLEPDRPLPEALVAMPLAMLALADALAAPAPPQKPIGFAWPDAIVVDGARVGGACLAVAPTAIGAVPDWLVIGLALQLRLPVGTSEPGQMPERTALVEEGFGELDGLDLVEPFARHLLHWMHRLEDEGPAPALAAFGRQLVGPDGKAVRIEPTGLILQSVDPPGRRQSLAAALGLEEPA